MRLKKKAEVLMGELIGEEIQVTKSTRKELIGTKGIVIDETLNILIIEKNNKEMKIPKKQCWFKVKGVEINGMEIAFRPEDRIKKYWRKFNAIMQR